MTNEFPYKRGTIVVDIRDKEILIVLCSDAHGEAQLCLSCWSMSRGYRTLDGSYTKTCYIPAHRLDCSGVQKK